MSTPRTTPLVIAATLLALVGHVAVAGSPRAKLRAQRGAPAAATGVSDDPAWIDQVVRELAASEYVFTQQGDGSYTAPNRAHGFRTRIQDATIELSPRDGEAGFALRLSPGSVGREGQLESIGDGRSFDVFSDRATFSAGASTFAVTNGESGLAHEIVLARAPGGSGPLVIELRLGGSVLARLAPNGASLLFEDAELGAVGRFGAIGARDREGRELPVTWHVKRGALQLVVDDSDASYPLTVSAVLGGPFWLLEANQATAHFGISAASAGDVDGDGYSDLLVGAYQYDNGQFNEGRAFLFRGSASGPLPIPAWTAEGNQAASYFGWSVASAGDVNGDGYVDVLVGSHLYDNGQNAEGRAHLFLGTPSGLSPSPAWTVEGDQDFAQAGRSLAGLGDVNGDGYADIAVGMYTYDNGHLNEGKVVVFHGSPSGPSTAPQWVAEGNGELAHFGISVSSAGDVNGDGYADLIVGAYQHSGDQPFEGRAHVYLGSPAGLSTEPVWTMEGNQPVAQFGHSVARAGDVNGDGFSDILVGANLYDAGQTDEGRAFLYLGSPDGPSLTPAWTAESDRENALFAHSLASAGDVNGDGYADVIVGAYQYSGEFPGEGSAYVYHGSPWGLRPRPSMVLRGGQAGAAFGYSVGTAGDMNGDGYSEVIAGAFDYDNGLDNEGAVRIYPGGAQGTSMYPQWTHHGEAPEDGFGGVIAQAGDVNGDGLADVVVGAPGADGERGRVLFFAGTRQGLNDTPDWTAEGAEPGARFGAAVAGAGDVNGDGFGDLLIGAPKADALLPEAGQAFIYLGSAMGPASAPSQVLSGEHAGGRFGAAVSSAGDVNGDGYADVIVGAPSSERGERDEGMAFLHLGSPSGVGGAVWAAEGGQAAARFGSTVASAGDVNADGFSDLLVGAPQFDDDFVDEGRVFLFLGSSTGPGAPVWMASGGQGEAFFGSSLSRAGDLDADGYSDIVIGAPGFDGFYPDSGAAFLFFGAEGGPSSVPDWSAVGRRAGDAFGTAVGAAGDVNADGFSDVFIGAPFAGLVSSDPGVAHVFLGAATGLAEKRPLLITGAQRFQRLGASGAGEGDVNGDGFSDLLLSAPGHAGGAGRVALFMGGGGAGVSRQPRQAESDGQAPIALLGSSDSSATFRVRATGHSPAGRASVRLEIEVKPQGSPFDGLGTTFTSFADTGQPALDGSLFLGFDELVSGIVPGPTVWRLRILSADPLFPRSRWFVPSGNASTETDLRLPAPNAATAP